MLCHFPTGSLQDHAAVNSSNLLMPLIPGADCLWYTWAGGESFIQHVKIDQWEIHYCVVVTETPAILEFRQAGDIVVLLLAQHGNYKTQDFITGIHELNELGTLLLRLPNLQGYITILPKEPCSKLLILTHKRIDTKDETETIEEGAHELRISPAMFQLMEKILYTNYSEVRPFHQEQLISLLQLAKELRLQPTPQPYFSAEAILALNEVKTYIDGHLDKDYRIDQLARKAGMNARKLNIGFKNLFGSNLFIYIREQRLVHAHDRIISTRFPLKVISKSAGYKSYSNFSAAFLRRFGYSPSSLRKQ